MSIHPVGSLSFLSPIKGPTSPTLASGKDFSGLMHDLTAGNPSQEDIKTFASYLQMRMNAALMRAMGGGEYVSPLSLFGNISHPEATPEATPTTGETPVASVPDLIEKAATTYNMEPALISAVIKAESGGNVRATSPKGAMGLMQLMPGTARELGVTDPYDPSQNIMAGTKYLRTLLDRYDGNRDLALAAYNWGPGNLEKSHRSMPRETVEYVARIKKYLGV